MEHDRIDVCRGETASRSGANHTDADEQAASVHLRRVPGAASTKRNPALGIASLAGEGNSSLPDRRGSVVAASEKGSRAPGVDVGAAGVELGFEGIRRVGDDGGCVEQLNSENLELICCLEVDLQGVGASLGEGCVDLSSVLGSRFGGDAPWSNGVGAVIKS